MGCFSYICKESGKSVTSTSFSGDPVRMYLLKDGKVIEEMRGHYDSYGRVFDDKDDSFEWKKDWGECVDMHFNKKKPGDGFAVILEQHFTGKIPTTISEDDPMQGWGKSQVDKRLKINKGLKPRHIVYGEGGDVIT